MAVMADNSISQPTAMATRLGLLICVAVLACLVQPSSAGHKKKIIVKVPHVIKHIHHDHYKPIHIHKVRQKKVEHHHHKKNEGKHKAHGSYSHLKPVLIHQGTEEQVEHPEDHSQGREYDLRQHYGRGLEYEPGREYGQQTSWRSGNKNGYWNTKESVEDSREGNWRPVGLMNWMNDDSSNGEYSGEARPVSGEEPTTFREGRGFSNGKRLMNWMNDDSSNGEYSGEARPVSGEELTTFREGRGFSNGKRKKNNNQVVLRTKNEPEDQGWRPMMDFSGWRDEQDIRNNPREHHSEQYNYSGENYSDGSDEERYAENIYKKQKKPRKNKKKKWSKQIEVREPSNEHELPQIPQQPVQQQPLNIPQPVKQNPQPVHWPFLVQQPQQEQNKWPALQQTQHQQWLSPQTTAATWHAATPSPQPTTQAAQPMVVWSGHHLQLPEQTMWQVQQHSVQVPVSASSTPPRPVLPPQPSPLLSLRQQRQPSAQLQQASFPVQHVQLPSWPMDRKIPQGQPQVKQHWEQSVITSSKNGPASSYKVEVINYADQKNTRT